MIASQLKESIYTGFIDKQGESLEKYRPKLLVNNHKAGQKVSTSIINELNECEEFYFSVAFITYGGLLVLMNTLDELEERGIKGKIIASQYLNFTDPKALKKLLNYSNIELRMMTSHNHHAKGYIFKHEEHHNMIIGSSNMTQDALSTNKEWNVKLSSMDEGQFLDDTINEFNQAFELAHAIDEAWIEQYTEIYKVVRKSHFSATQNVSQLVLASDTRNDNRNLLIKVNPNKMQVAALAGIEAIRQKGENRALLISATGTGKTYLACFDVAKQEPKRVLFLAHREQILDQSITSFKNVLGYDIKCGKVSGGKKELDARFVFSTVQSMSKSSSLDAISKDCFDYIIIDESHRAGAKSYQRILQHFEPEFMLGMTATPERTDDHNICKDFNYNIAYEIRLEQAMEEDMLCPFHYFGITELSVDGEPVDDNSDFSRLVNNQRVEHIINKIEHYGYNGDSVKGLIFCSRNDEAESLSKAFNMRGYRTKALSGSNSQNERLDAVKRLESNDESRKLDYIFTVDIFNEGVDIPMVNQIVMLRPTQSAIVFVQQLGRGLRKYEGKDFVVILDFIGNYKNNFMIPMALSDDRSFNKDTIRRFVAEGNRVIPGCTTINFDQIARKKIYESIDNINFNQIAFIKESYQNLKYRLGRIPLLMDFEEHDAMDLAKIFGNKRLKSYYSFLVKYDKDYHVRLTDQERKFVEFISHKLAMGKRPHELLVIKGILSGQDNLYKWMANKLRNDYNIIVKNKTYRNVLNVLTDAFTTGTAKGAYKDAKILDKDFNTSPGFSESLSNSDFRDIVEELTDYGLYRNNKYYGKRYKNSSFELYKKYSYEDVCRLLEWEQGDVALNIGGYKHDVQSKTYPVFINYDKDDHISDTIKYEDRFVSNNRLIAMSKSKRRIDSKDIVTAYSANERGIDMELFVRKNKDDKESKEFYYLGRMNTIGNPKQLKMPVNNNDIVELTYQLDTHVRDDIYDYITHV